MPIKDDAARRRYFRDYMRERRAGQKKPGPNGPDADVGALREQIHALESELENAKRATAVAAEEVALTLELHAAEKRISTLQARVTRAEQAAKEAAVNADAQLQRKFADASKKLAEARARLRALAKSPVGKVFIPADNRRKILRCLHPDAVPDPALKKRYEEAFQIFSNLPYTEIQDD
jgi:regulator of replication initiation timing